LNFAIYEINDGVFCQHVKISVYSEISTFYRHVVLKVRCSLFVLKVLVNLDVWYVVVHTGRCGTGSLRCWQQSVWLEFSCWSSTSLCQLSIPTSSLRQNGESDNGPRLSYPALFWNSRPALKCPTILKRSKKSLNC